MGATINRVQSILPHHPPRARRLPMVYMPFQRMLGSVLSSVLCVVVLSGCNKPASDMTAADAPAGSAQAQFNTMVNACTRSVAARVASVVKDGSGQWVKTGFSAALVQGEVNATQSAVTPFVGKIVVKDNHARATSPTEAEVRAIILAPVHLLSHRTHTFVYQFDGQRWQWNNGSLSTKTPVQPEATRPVNTDELAAPDNGFMGCLPS